MTLNEIKVGQTAYIDAVGGEGALRQHLLDMGVIPGVKATVVRFAPMMDPMEIRIRGYQLTLRLDDAKKISVIPLDGEEEIREHKPEKPKASSHPGLGELNKTHFKEHGSPLPAGTKLTYALVGNQNSG
ncbi:MAG: ferrous iron transport protein A, partial [Clostridia bacterium]|nr:ferrous iron transport protein A [Clostridia bacterium]